MSARPKTKQQQPKQQEASQPTGQWALRPSASPFFPENTHGLSTAGGAFLMTAAEMGTSERLDVARLGKSQFGELNEQFTQARNWAKHNPLVAKILLFQGAFYNFGLALRTEGGRVGGKRGTLRPWWDEKGPAVRSFIGHVWAEWLRVSSVIVFWEDGYPAPMIVTPESVKFEDLGGRQTLKFAKRLSLEKLEDFSPVLKGLFGQGWKMINDLRTGETFVKDEEGRMVANARVHFRVLKRAPMGEGLGSPEMLSVFPACKTYQGMQAGDDTWATLMRTPFELWRKGHEIKSGPHAGFKTNFMTDDWANGFAALLKGAVGHQRLVANFDTSVSYPFPDPKFFDEKKYNGAAAQIMQWGMPIAQMIFSKGMPSPFLMTILRVAGTAERETVGGFLNGMVNLFFKPPERVTVEWDPKIFQDPKILAALIQYGLKAGPVSQETFLETAGLDAPEERERKAGEAALPPEHTSALSDPDHGGSPLGDRAGSGGGSRRGGRRGRTPNPAKPNGRPSNSPG